MDKNCGFLLPSDRDLTPAGPAVDVKKQLMAADVGSKIEGMKALIHAHLRGDPHPSTVMTVIQHVVPSPDHALKKLVLLYWELIDKRGPDGKLLPEMILVCNFIRNDLHHANEYARGVTLRFLAKTMEADILEPLIPSIVQNLSHALPYVRKNALLVLFNMFRHLEALVPDAPALVEQFLADEAARGSDPACIRNAFLMLSHCAPEQAVRYMLSHLDAGLDETLQLLMLELIRREARRDPARRSAFVRPLIVLLDSRSAAVQYDGAAALLSLSASGSAVRRAAETYIGLLADHPDGNVRLIALGRLDALCARHPALVGDMAPEVLRAIASPSVEIRCRALALAEGLVSQRNVEQVRM
jgi:coatomer subunit beta